MKPELIGVLGARSFIGDCLLEALVAGGFRATAISRQAIVSDHLQIEWQQWPDDKGTNQPVSHWISLLPIWILPDFFPYLEQKDAQRIVALSSTSRFVKADSTDDSEKAVATSLAKGEEEFQAWSERTGIQWTILRPTLVYGLGRDKNISEIARLTKRFGFFPLSSNGCGLRQPIHAEDVATACLQAMRSESTINRAYNISGGVTLPYRDMVVAVFKALHKTPHFFPVPLWAVKMLMPLARLNPAYRQWSATMFERMGHNLVFDHSEAVRDFGFSPKGFSIHPEDLPQ